MKNTVYTRILRSSDYEEEEIPMITEQIITLRKQLKSKLDPMRYEHSVSVSFTCTALAMRYG